MSSTSGISGSSQNQAVLQLMQQLRQAQAQKAAATTTTVSGTSNNNNAAASILQFFQTATPATATTQSASTASSTSDLLSGGNALQASDNGSLTTSSTAQDALLALISSIQSALGAAQSSGTENAPPSGDRKTEFQQALFKQLDGNGDGSITQDEVESAVTKAGGTKESADALYAKLDPDNTGSVSEQQFAQNLPPPPPPPGGPGGGGGEGPAGGASASSSGIGSYDPLDTNQDGTVSTSERLAGLGITTADDNATDTALTDTTGKTSVQSMVAQIRKDMMNFLIALQSKTDGNAAGGATA